MLSEFITYYRLGIGHIADLRGYDHIVFIVALTAGYAWRAWRRLVWLVTAFTVGHSVTLALATLNVVQAPSRLIELLIAVTIVATGVYGLVRYARARDAAGDQAAQRALYAMAGVFGLIHGLGFSTFLRSVLGAEESIALPLLAFNVGLEIGQLAIVGTVLLVGALLCERLGLSRARWATALSLVSALVGAKMVLERMS